MSWDFSQVPKKSSKTEKSPYEDFEMCDICCHTYHFTLIRRLTHINDYGTTYVIRCCPNCNIEQLTPYL